jgi:hypothetical protein
MIACRRGLTGRPCLAVSNESALSTAVRPAPAAIRSACQRATNSGVSSDSLNGPRYGPMCRSYNTAYVLAVFGAPGPSSPGALHTHSVGALTSRAAFPVTASTSAIACFRHLCPHRIPREDEGCFHARKRQLSPRGSLSRRS